jgi:peptidylprolyl isomerase
MFLAVGFALSLASSAQSQTDEAAALAVAQGRTVSMDYRLRLADGTVLETSDDDGPLTFVVGRGEFFPAAETQMAGMKKGDKRSLRLSADNAYGAIDPELMIEVELEKVPEDVRKPGLVVGVRSPDGEVRRVRVAEVKETGVVLDLNHPLAGKDVVVDVEILSVE